MVILILINIAVIICIYLKYYKFSENINTTTEKIEDKDSIIIGYINDGGFNNNFDFILAQIIELNIKGFLTIIYGKENIDKYNYTIKQNVDIGSDKLNKYEMLIMNFLFSNKTEITRMELEEKLSNTFSSYNARFNEIEKVLNDQLLMECIIDDVKQKELARTTKKFIKLSIVSIVLITILGLFKVLELSVLYMLMYILEKTFSIALLLKASTYTTEGQILKYNIESYKINLEKQEFLSNKNTMEKIVLEKEFANSIALHINTQAKRTFIDEKIIKDATKMSKKAIINMLIVFIIIILIALIMAKITTLLSPTGAFWLYLILTIACACVADITLYKKK